MNYIYWFTYSELTLSPGNEANLFMVDKFFDVLLDSVGQYFIKDICVIAHQEHQPEVFVVAVSLPDFGIQTMLVS